MPTIPGPTDRRLRVLGDVDVAQAATLATALAAAGWVVRRGHGAGPALALGAVTAAAGAAAAFGRWPPGPRGEALTALLAAALRFRLRPRRRPDLPLGLPVELLGGGALAVRGRRRILLRVAPGHGHAAPGGLAARQAAYRELAHALEGPWQVVVASRFLGPGDRPRSWDPEAVPSGLRAVAAAYAAHWQETVEGRLLHRQAWLVAAGPGAAEAVRAFAARAALRTEAPAALDLAAALRGMLGAPEDVPWAAEGPVWGVRGPGEGREP